MCGVTLLGSCQPEIAIYVWMGRVRYIRAMHGFRCRGHMHKTGMTRIPYWNDVLRDRR